MFLNREKVSEYLENFLSSKDRERFAQYMDIITDLSWMGSIVLEYGFTCPKNTRKESKKRFFELIQKLSDFRKEINAPIYVAQNFHQTSFAGGYPLTVEDFTVVCDLFYTLAEESKKISKDKLLPWLEEAWDAGVHQQRVYDMEIEGCIMNEYGIVTALGAELVMFGHRKGLIPESCLR